MHSLYFVKIPKKDVTTGEDAILVAEKVLDQEGFASEGGYFNCSKSDWYVVGGRWSGKLQELKLGINFSKEVKKKIKPKDSFGFSSSEIEKNKDKIDKIWRKLGGHWESPFDRDDYSHEGYPDDAMRIDKDILKSLKAEYKDVEVYDSNDIYEYSVKDLDKNSIGDWLVTIDYHI